MITSAGTIQVSTPSDEKMQREYSHVTFAAFLTVMIVGIVGVLLWFGILIVRAAQHLPDIDELDVLLWISAILFVFGLFVVLAVRKNNAKARNSAKIITCEFFNDHILLTETDRGETVGWVKVYLYQILRGKETKNYLFFTVDSRGTYPVDKTALTDWECNALRRLFRLPERGQTSAVPPCAPTIEGENTMTADSSLRNAQADVPPSRQANAEESSDKGGAAEDAQGSDMQNPSDGV